VTLNTLRVVPLTLWQNPSGSSTGSAVAVSAGFAPVSLGADFNGSLTNPAIRAALYTIRTTPGIVSEHRGFPFSKNRDSLGPMAKSTEDLVNLLNVIVDVSQPEVPDQGYPTSLSRDWKDLSFATMDPHHWYLPEAVQKPQPGALDQIVSTFQ
jgi:amidase